MSSFCFSRGGFCRRSWKLRRPGAPILTDADWEKFKQYFNSVYPDFVLALKTKSPKLSSAELRLVMLAKMGLSTKESAAMLGISIDAVKKGRYRLRKKLNLSGDPLADLL
jgi:DNA-binding CsgD family transcriptional regulator